MEPGRSVVAVSLPWCNTQLFAQKQEKKKVSQKHIRLAFCSIILHFRVNTQENLNRGREQRRKEGGRRLFLSPPNHFTHPRFSNCLTRSLTPPPLFRSVAPIHPSILRPFAPRQFRCAAGRSIGLFLHRCEPGWLL